MMIRPALKPLALALLVLALPATAARAGFMLYGIDQGVGPTPANPTPPQPNSDAVKAQFLALPGAVIRSTIDFEGLPASQAPDGVAFRVTLDGSVTATTTNTDHTLVPGYQFGVTNLPNTDTVENNAALGFSTPGTQHFKFVTALNASTSTFSIHLNGGTFNAFGFYLTGLGDEQGSLSVSFGGTTVPISGSTQGGVLYFAYVGTPAPVTDFTITETRTPSPTNRDVFGIDDITLATVPLPAPPAWVLSGIGLACGLGGRALGLGARRASAERS
jgi:hypothetical protein